MNARKYAVTGVVAVVACVLGYIVAPASQATAPPRPNGPSSTGSRALSAPTVPATTESTFVPVHACRAANTAAAGGRIHPNTTRSFTITGTSGFSSQGGSAAGCGVPTSATVVSLRITASAATKSGSVAVYPTGAATSLATLYYGKSARVATGATVALAAGAPKPLTVKQQGGDAQLSLDVVGYYAPPINAFLEGDGSLSFTSGRATSTSHPSTGNYIVTFDRDVSTCSYAVTPYAFNYPVAAGPQGGDPNSVHIYIHDQGSSTTPHDTSFYLLVTC